MAPHQLERTLISRDPLLVVVLGPTASGKTTLAIEIARLFGGEIVNCDSVALYRDFNIGTAKPTAEERALAPHHLFDVVEPDHYTTAGEYARMARAILAELRYRGVLPVVAGGTGLYLRALIDGLFRGPERSEALRERLRERAQCRGSQSLHRILRRFDPSAAGRIHSNDVPKVIRALEVCFAARRPLSEQWEAGREPLTGFRILRIGLDPVRPRLYERINARVVRMFEAGLVEEARTLLARYGQSAQPFSSIGYREALQLVQGGISREAAILATQQAQRNYAKRQMTWFRREPDVHWITGFGDEHETRGTAKGLVEKSL